MYSAKVSFTSSSCPVNGFNCGSTNGLPYIISNGVNLVLVGAMCMFRTTSGRQ